MMGVVMAKTVLVVDDDPTQRRLIQAVLEREGFAVAQAESGQQALDRLAGGQAADVVVLDWVMPGLSGLETLKEMRTRGVRVPVLILTANGGVDTVVQAMQAGAQDFFVKPASPERIIVSIRNALQMGDYVAEVTRLTKRHSNTVAFDDLVGASAPMEMVKRMGERGAKSGAPILILGESGVGKELIARAVHGASERNGKPFVAVNCGALPENLVESILFGHEKGAFTGAVDKHSGKFQEAHGGALFLDEIGELPPTCRSSCCARCRKARSTRSAPSAASRSTSHHQRHQPRPAAAGEGRRFRGTVLPAERVPIEAPACVSAWDRAGAGRALHPPLQRGGRQAGEAATPETLAMLQGFDWRATSASWRTRSTGHDPGRRPLPAAADFRRSRAWPCPGRDPARRGGRPQGAARCCAAADPGAAGPVRILDDKGHLRTWKRSNAT